MRIILHIGMPKAGSTALQFGLAGMRPELVESGALYPKSPIIQHKHALMISELVPDDAVPRLLRQKYDADFPHMRADARAWWQRVERRVKNVQPDTLILSDEWLFSINDERGLANLARRLRALADAVEVVAYVRRPSEFYLSVAQQALKASHQIRPVEPVEYRRPLERYAKHVADALHVFPYDRSTWPNGDILHHFLSKFAPSFDAASDKVSPSRNESMSAEAMSVLADYRRSFWSHADQQFTQDTRRLVHSLRLADKELDGSRRPELHPSIREYLDQTSTDLLWLRDVYDIVFDEVDYDALHADPAPIEQPQRVEEICNVDAERKADLTLHTMRQLAEPRPRQRQQPSSADEKPGDQGA